ncbi:MULTISPECIES: heme biosynthesis protein HemY [unclassified Acinetobacter]|uniref:heme biosynthesis protein HemY n=1 Tax=unclassified Acinetobacter TaxID=196816 RepID=UPI00190C8327|nr:MULTISPECIES: heme biosynthesis protein HemY [unclassified Acinetobacter]MBK0064727.1 heme biosynthesis protein HemY [Acinetobacter sp. S55]MBK0068035.1 heme biosynthesis protein HemY [Acinetobacter sp. S54]
MRALLQTYAVVALCLLALLSVLSYGYGAGYVYIYWRDWQLQTNVWILLLLIGVLTLSVQLIWMTVRRYLHREQRKLETVFNLSHLHPYEQLGVIWLLEAAKDQQNFVNQVFEKSGLLKGIVEAKLLFQKEEYDQALNALNHTSPMAFELAELQRIELFLAKGQTEQALTHLEFLQQHQLSPWLKQIEQAYQQRITVLWGQLALQQPWVYLRSLKYGHLDPHSRDMWLQQLLTQFDQASLDDLHAIQQRYLDLEQEIKTRPYTSKVLWLKLLARLPEMSLQHEMLALHLLNEQFDRDVFYLWFQQQLLKQNPDYRDIEKKIEQFEQRYLSMPILTFAKWHVYMATKRQTEADELLQLYPDDVLMSYLRIKSQLNESQIQQLNLVFENDANFLQFKI